MKILLSLLLIFISFSSFGQSQYKYQVRLNPVAIGNFYYAGSIRVGIETVNRKWNFGMDHISYSDHADTRKMYYKDSFFHKITNEKSTFVSGVGINVMKAINFKTNGNRLIVGLQGFVGTSRQTNRITNTKLDTSHYISPYHGVNTYYWRSDNQNETIEKHGPKLALGICTFVRLQFEIYKRFTFTPELMFPFVFRNFVYGPTDGPLNVDVDFYPGFNFCLGYKFGKVKT